MELKSIKNPLKIYPKIEVGKRTAQNTLKSRPGAPKGRKCRSGCLAGLAILSRWVPTNQQKERGLYSDDPTRQWAVGPANFKLLGKGTRHLVPIFADLFYGFVL